MGKIWCDKVSFKAEGVLGSKDLMLLAVTAEGLLQPGKHGNPSEPVSSDSVEK